MDTEELQKNNEFYNLKNKVNTGYYAKIFLLMIIPIYGLFFTILLAFSKDVSYELKVLSRGALIARIVLISVFIVLAVIFIWWLFPMIIEYLNKINILKLLKL